MTINDHIAIVDAYINKGRYTTPWGDITQEQANRSFNEICEFIRRLTSPGVSPTTEG